MVNRNAGAGTRVLIDKLVKGARPAGYANQPRSHNAVAAAIAQGRADWGIAIEPVAKLYELRFLPIAPEDYDFILVDSRRDRPAVQAFLAALRDDKTRERIRALGMRPADCLISSLPIRFVRQHESRSQDHDRQHHMQPLVRIVDMNHAEQHVAGHEEAEHGDNGIDDAEHFQRQRGADAGIGAGQNGDSGYQMNKVMRRIDRENSSRRHQRIRE